MIIVKPSVKHAINESIYWSSIYCVRVWKLISIPRGSPDRFAWDTLTYDKIYKSDI